MPYASTRAEHWTANPHLNDVPVRLVSAGGELAEVAQQFDVRASLATPVDMGLLRAAIQRLLAHPNHGPEPSNEAS